MARKNGKSQIRICYEKMVGEQPIKNSEITKSEYHFKKNLKTLREYVGLSQFRLAEILQVNESYYSKMERLTDHVSPPFEWYDVLAKFYGIEPYCLFVEDIEKYIILPNHE